MWTTKLLSRNYVRSQMNTVLQNASNELTGTGIEIRYLDACFPFINKFPLLPHLSHNDGKKLDISLVYETAEKQITNNKKSISGYGVFAEPTSAEFNQIISCIANGYWQYDLTKYATLGRINDALVFSSAGTKKLVNAILKQPDIGKILIEPHLKTRLELNNPKVRFQGCHAVRHDDHIHIQLR